MSINYSNSELLPAPLRVSTYSEDDRKRQFQWVISSLDEDIIRIWDSAINGETDILELNEVGDLVKVMDFVVTTGTTGSGAVLNIQDCTLSLGGEVALESDPTVSYDIKLSDWEKGGLQVEKNGVRLSKTITAEIPLDVTFITTNQIQINSRLQQGDRISFVYYTGL